MAIYCYNYECIFKIVSNIKVDYFFFSFFFFFFFFFFYKLYTQINKIKLSSCHTFKLFSLLVLTEVNIIVSIL